jgi:uncharacterized coiled-coil protein SlyX
MTPSLSRRLQYLEEKFAFLEQTVDELNEVIIDQLNQISSLQDQVRKLQTLLDTAQLTAQQEEDPPPPHY